MKLCFVLHSDFPPKYGHTTPYMYSEILAEEGHRITLLVKKCDPSRVFHGNLNVISMDCDDDFLFVVRVCMYMLKFKPDFDLISVIYDKYVILLFLWCKLLRRRMKMCVDIRSGPIGKIQWPGKFQRIITSSFSDFIFLPSKHMIKKCTAVWQKNKVFIMPLGAPDSAMKKRTDNRGTVTFIYVGSIHSARKLEDMIEGFRLAYEKKSNIRLIILGDGPYKEKLLKLTVKYEMQNVVEFVGVVPFEHVTEYLARADVGISYIPIKRYNEMPPLKILEYLASGLPVIATATQGTKSFIKDRTTGILINDDAESLSLAIVELSLNATLRKNMSNNAVEITEKHSWKRIVHDIAIPAYVKITGQK